MWSLACTHCLSVILCRRPGQLVRPAPDVSPPHQELPDAHPHPEVPSGRHHHQPPAAASDRPVEDQRAQQEGVQHAGPYQTVSVTCITQISYDSSHAGPYQTVSVICISQKS